jgi:hypothetical protein
MKSGFPFSTTYGPTDSQALCKLRVIRYHRLIAGVPKPARETEGETVATKAGRTGFWLGAIFAALLWTGSARA